MVMAMSAVAAPARACVGAEQYRRVVGSRGSSMSGRSVVAALPTRGGARSHGRGGAVVVHAARFLLKNSGPKTTDHLGAEVEIPGDLELLDARMVVGRERSESVNLPVGVPTGECGNE